MIGHTSIFNTSDGDGGFFSNLANDIESDIQDAVNNFTSDVARAINIHDFYAAHILNYCEGYYEPNATVEPGHKKPHENVTSCSNRTALFHFDPTKIIEQELKPGVNLTDIKWPSQIEDGIRVLEAAGKAMFALYCIGIGFAGIGLIGAVFGLIASGRISALFNFILCIVSPLSTTLLNRSSNPMDSLHSLRSESHQPSRLQSPSRPPTSSTNTGRRLEWQHTKALDSWL
jgi:hypothetical protein